MRDSTSRSATLVERLHADGVMALVSIDVAYGSTPREQGAMMIVMRDGSISGTIGGGALEYAAIREAVALMTKGVSGDFRHDYPLGPDLGQCCGGRVSLVTDIITRSEQQRLIDRLEASADDAPTVLFLFGAGHVGRALTMSLAGLPFHIRWIDNRAEAFPSLVPRNAEAVLSQDPVTSLTTAPANAFILVMTHSHALDLALIDAALRRNDFAYIGLIGSATKRARFESRLRDAGHGPAVLERLICPIGLPDIRGKEPPVIAASVAADLLIRRERVNLKAQTSLVGHASRMRAS